MTWEQYNSDECRTHSWTFIEIYSCIGYMLPTIWGACDSWIYMLILDILCKHLGDECKPEGFCVPSGHRVRSEHLWEYIFVLDICWQQFWEHVTVENICWYWIFHANIWGMNVSKRVSVCPSGTGMESEHLYLIYAANNVGSLWQLKQILILDITGQHLGDECKL